MIDVLALGENFRISRGLNILPQANITNIRRRTMLQWLAYLLPNPDAQWSMPRVTEIFSEEIIDNGSEVNQRHSLEESGPWLEIVNRTHVVIQKHNKHQCFHQVCRWPH